MFTPPSETETSDSPVNSDTTSPNQVSPLASNSASSVRRSVSFKDRVLKGDDETSSLKRRNSDIELKVG